MNIADKLEAMITRTVSDDMLHHEAATEIRRLRAELAEAKKPDCRTCLHGHEIHEEEWGCYLRRNHSPIVCINGDAYVSHGARVKLYKENSDA